MVFAGQAMFGGVGEHAAQHPAQRVARQHVISDVSVAIVFLSPSDCCQLLSKIAAGRPTRLLAMVPPAAGGGQQA